MENTNKILTKPKPFLRWAGGKRWFLKELKEFVNINNFNSYHEPFIGGGSVFFYLSPQKGFISDFNEELINSYNSIKNNPEEIIELIQKYKKTKEEYYFIRNKKFNSDFEKAAQFIYLNQMSFNGIYRVNLKGEYNVPYGYRNSYNFDLENIRTVSIALKNIEIIHQDFEKSIDNVKKGDLVFLDPPYTVTHNTNGFIHYNQKLFSINDQYRLSNTINYIKEIGAFYILTNAAHQKIKEIFSNGDKMIEIERACLIGGKNAERGKFTEIIITNI